MKKIMGFFNNLFKKIKLQTCESSKLKYRVVQIEKNKHGDYEVIVQIIGKTATFKMKPEEILADDIMTDSFAQKDIRTLTYLGYLDINTPKYKILAKRLSEKDNRMIFCMHKKGDDNPTIKTAKELSQDDNILSQMNQHDAHMIGYTTASEAMLDEKLEQKKLINKEISEVE